MKFTLSNFKHSLWLQQLILCSFPVKCFSVKSDIFNWRIGVKRDEKIEVLRSSPGRSRSDIGRNVSGSSSGSPPRPRDTPRSRTNRRRSTQFHCLNAGCCTHFLTSRLRDNHMRRDCQFRTQVDLFYLAEYFKKNSFYFLDFSSSAKPWRPWD